MQGGLGDDAYYVDAAGDSIGEEGDGIDSVFSSITYTLGSTLENLTLTGTAAINGTGNEEANILTGNNGANRLIGGLGIDTLNGGLGNDNLTGGEGGDVFLFSTALSGTANKDIITDFIAGEDHIHLENTIFSKLISTGSLSEGNFHASSTGVALDSYDYILYNTTTGGLFYDMNGSAAGGSIQFATLTPATTGEVKFTDFVVV